MRPLALASKPAATDTASCFLRSCTSTSPTAFNTRLVARAASILRSAVSSNDTGSVQALIEIARLARAAAPDILSAAQQVAIEPLLATGPSNIQSAFQRFCRISSDALDAVQMTPTITSRAS